MIEYQATVQGLDQLQRQMAQAPSFVIEETVHAVDKSLVAYQATAREKAPIDKSPLRNSITIVPAKVEGSTINGSVGTDIHYAEAQEAGTGIYGPMKRPIRPKNKKVMVWERNGKKFFAKQTKGVRGKFYMKGSLEQNQANTDRNFAQAAENVATRIAIGGGK